MSIRYDDDNLSVTFSRNGTDYTIHCNGLAAQVAHRLMLVGAVSLLKTKKDPMKSWQDIRAGAFEKRRTKHLPKAVRALSMLNGEPIHQVWEAWKVLDKKERREIMKNKEVRRMIIDLE